MAADDVEMLPYPSKAGKGQQHGLRHRLPVISGPGGRQAAAWIVRLPAIRIILAAIVVILLTGTLSSCIGYDHDFTRPIIDDNGMISFGHQPEPFETDATPGDHRLVLVLPADKPGLSVCKTVTSALALGYPMPVLVNWGADPRERWGNKGGSNLLKITGVLEYLDEMLGGESLDGHRLRPEDLVAMVDPSDAWFQLPPEVLLARYHEGNGKANKRLEKEWAGRSGEEMPVKQTIIASAQKRCWPTQDMGPDPHCDKLPASPARKDLYGSKTDIEQPEDESKRFHDLRPRFLNSGFIIGPAADLHRYFRRVKEKLDRKLGEGERFIQTDQGIFAEVFAEQEIYRQWLLDQQKEGKLAFPTGEGSDMLDDNFEFHLGLDYGQVLSAPTNHAETDGDFLLLDDKAHIKARSKDLKIKKPRLVGVPPDLKDARVPAGVIGSLHWGNMSLYADFFSGSVPVTVHHDAYRDGLKARATEWWDRTWFFPQLRELLSLRLKDVQDLSPLATLPAGKEDKLVYWPLTADLTGHRPRVFKADLDSPGLGEISFEDMCRPRGETPDVRTHWYDEVFRDGKGTFSV
ncbi:unnamed protein product [Clonostachys rosea f. rosea IK726]|uniref:Uncharacterized protein n=1 Tax=Clonostachys rosea f. rosea IK726 TaxID=1349383 RepID=A0ACA9TZ90_BIOOC|nr:unnamed protein product [Clonostachys rosea f. rosea IK726]